MTPLALRGDAARRGAALDHATAFVRALVAGDTARARAALDATAAFCWFGAPVAAAAWSRAGLRRFFGRDACVEHPRPIASDLAARLDRGALSRIAGVALEDGDRIVLVDVLCTGAPRATLGVAVRAGVVAAFDPHPLRALLEATARAVGEAREPDIVSSPLGN